MLSPQVCQIYEKVYTKKPDYIGFYRICRITKFYFDRHVPALKSGLAFMRNLLSLIVIFYTSFSFSQDSFELQEVKLQDSYREIKLIPGKILPTKISRLAFEIPGSVNKIDADIGDAFFKGDLLAELDNREASANLMRAEAKYKLSKLALDRLNDLKTDGFISAQELDKANAEYDVAKSELEYFKVKLSQTKIIAPYDGFIQNRMIDQGTIISPGVNVFEFVDSSSVEAHISIPDKIIDNLIIGEEYFFTIKEKKINAVLSRIAPMTIGGSTNRLAIFRFNEFISPGSIGYLNYENRVTAKGLWVPFSALSESDQGLWSLYVLNSNNNESKIARELVELLHVEDRLAYVSGTLSPGEKIIVGGASKVIEGKVYN